MANICLTFGTSASQSDVMHCINTIDGLNKWWTTDTRGDTSVGEEIIFRFNSAGPNIRVLKNDPLHVQWEVTGGIDEWIGTKIDFKVHADDLQTHLMFKHLDWPEETPFHHHCTMKWATFLLSMKNYLETGTGQPFPNDIHIELS